MLPLVAIYRVGLLFVEKREPAELGRRPPSANVDPAFIPPHVLLWAGPPRRSKLILLFTNLADILGSFDIKKLLYKNRFSSHKRPKIFIVLT